MRTAVVRTRTLVLGLALAALCPALYAQTGAASITGIADCGAGATHTGTYAHPDRVTECGCDCGVGA